jgi:threonine/homoserine/homoserine lactone efflux protein
LAKLAGAVYLMWLGLRMIFSKRGGAHSPAVKPMATYSEIFWQGFLTNVLNPKVAIFFLAFLPQFIDADAPSKTGAFLFLGAMFNVIGTGWNLLVARVAAHAAAQITAQHRIRLWMDRAIGGLFLFVGLRLATAER